MSMERDKIEELYKRIRKLEDENTKIKAMLEDGISFGLQPEDCKEVLARISKEIE